MFDPAEVQHIERQLAGYIGPLAKHLVKQAAPRAAGVDDLVAGWRANSTANRSGANLRGAAGPADLQ